MGIEATAYTGASQMFLMSFLANASMPIPTGQGNQFAIQGCRHCPMQRSHRYRNKDVNKLLEIGMGLDGLPFSTSHTTAWMRSLKMESVPVVASKRPRATAAILGAGFCALFVALCTVFWRISLNLRANG